MKWQDKGVLISVQPFGEQDAIISLLTENHGRVRGIMKRIKSPRNRLLTLVGNTLDVTWFARLDHHLGRFIHLHLITSTTGSILTKKMRLNSLLSACTLFDKTLAERDPAQEIYGSFQAFLALLETDSFLEAYIALECELLKHLGFGLDFNKCGATGQSHTPQNPLVYVSPRTGRAVSIHGGGAWKHRLLPLPSFLRQYMTNQPIDSSISTVDLLQGLSITEHFLKRFFLQHYNTPLPDSRSTLKTRLCLIQAKKMNKNKQKVAL